MVPAGQGSDMTKEEVREQAKQAVLGRLTKEEEEERSTRNKEMLPSEKNLGHMTLQEKFDFARRYKEAGNVFFKENKYEFALKNYTETITYLRHGLRMGQTNSEGVPLGAMRQELDPESKEIIASCQSNMAACALKLGRMEDVVKHASAALDQDIKEGAKARALFRRSKAYHAMGKVEEAHADVAEAAREAPGDKVVQQHLQVVGREFRELKKKEREAARTLWQGKLKQEEGADTTEEKKTKEGKGRGQGEDEAAETGQSQGGFLNLGFVWRAIRGLFAGIFGG